MKVAILSESSVDEEAIRLLSSAVLGTAIQPYQPVRIKNRGWSGVFQFINSVYRTAHFHAEVAGVIAVVDSDDQDPHVPEHEADGFRTVDCRLCQLHQAILQIRASLKPDPIIRTAPLKFAIGLAVPSIEAWYRCGVDNHCTELHFRREAKGTLRQERRRLKSETYGAVQAPEPLMMAKMREHLREPDVARLALHFPNGFGSLKRALEHWRD
jgi:hypothetical protein